MLPRWQHPPPCTMPGRVPPFDPEAIETPYTGPPANFMDLLHDAVCVVDADGRLVFVSAACHRIFGYTPDEMVGRKIIDMVVPEDRERTLEAAREIMSGNPEAYFENRYLRKDGRVAHIMWSARWSETDQLRVAVARDVTGRRLAEAMQSAMYEISEAAHNADDLVALFRRVHQIIGGLLPVDDCSVVMYDAAEDRLDVSYRAHEDEGTLQRGAPEAAALCAEVIRTGHSLLLDEQALAALPEPMRVAGGGDLLCWMGVPLSSQQGTIGVLVLTTRAGGVRYTEADEALLHFVSAQIATAIERKRLYASLQRGAQYDELTGLPNRRLLFDRLDMALARARRGRWPVCLLYIDLNGLKRVNDSLGHAAGDRLLQGVASRLKETLRASDTVARMGGDEFVVMLENLQEPEHVSLVVDKIRAAVGQPMDIAGHSVSVHPSIGTALYPEHGDDAQQLLSLADQAMYFDKRSTRDEPIPG